MQTKTDSSQIILANLTAKNITTRCQLWQHIYDNKGKLKTKTALINYLLQAQRGKPTQLDRFLGKQGLSQKLIKKSPPTPEDWAKDQKLTLTYIDFTQESGLRKFLDYAWSVYNSGEKKSSFYYLVTTDPSRDNGFFEEVTGFTINEIIDLLKEASKTKDKESMIDNVIEIIKYKINLILDDRRKNIMPQEQLGNSKRQKVLIDNSYSNYTNLVALDSSINFWRQTPYSPSTPHYVTSNNHSNYYQENIRNNSNNYNQKMNSEVRYREHNFVQSSMPKQNNQYSNYDDYFTQNNLPMRSVNELNRNLSNYSHENIINNNKSHTMDSEVIGSSLHGFFAASGKPKQSSVNELNSNISNYSQENTRNNFDNQTIMGAEIMDNSLHGFFQQSSMPKQNRANELNSNQSNDSQEHTKNNQIINDSSVHEFSEQPSFTQQNNNSQNSITTNAINSDEEQNTLYDEEHDESSDLFPDIF